MEGDEPKVLGGRSIVCVSAWDAAAAIQCTIQRKGDTWLGTCATRYGLKYLWESP